LFVKSMHGIVCAIVTPMTPSGEIDAGSLRKLSAHLVKSGIHGVYPTGTNGEGILLSAEERREVAKTVVDEVSGRSVVVIQCTAATVEETLDHIRHAERIGADGAGVMTPFFFGLDHETLKKFYSQALTAAGPGFFIYAYNIPSHTTNDLTPVLLKELAEKHPNLVGIKFSDSDLMRIQDYMRAVPRRIDVLIGCDSLVLPALTLGASGTVSGPAMVFPHLFVGLYNAFKNNDYEQARDFQRKIIEMDRSLRGIPAIPAIKTMLKMQGIIESDFSRIPSRPLTREEYGTLESLVKKYSIL